MIIECTRPTVFGTYEISSGLSFQKPVLVLHRPWTKVMLNKAIMEMTPPKGEVQEYNSMDQAREIFKQFMDWAKNVKTVTKE